MLLVDIKLFYIVFWDMDIKQIYRYFFHKLRNPKAEINFWSTVSLDSTLGKGVKINKGVRLGSCSIESYSYIATNSILERTSIGNFCSIAADVVSGMGTHPLNFISTYPGFYSKNPSGAIWLGGDFPTDEFKRVLIGSDVWVGTRAIIMGGVSIGHGAVIGAGCVVTKDVPPYAIVGGIPSKIIKYRFSSEIIELLIKSEWWNLHIDLLKKAVRYSDNPTNFLKCLEDISN